MNSYYGCDIIFGLGSYIGSRLKAASDFVLTGHVPDARSLTTMIAKNGARVKAHQADLFLVNVIEFVILKEKILFCTIDGSGEFGSSETVYHVIINAIMDGLTLFGV